MKKEIKSFLSGVTLVVGLTLVFIVLKQTEITSWSWLAVISPLLAYATMLIIMFIITLCLYSHYKNNR
jgi:hypothetical protein|nr:MAG TPA: dystroglycan [Caudoviricetes sp.]DAZ02833.1 MAG TPA: dystroglycan [Caudoviricetes sp.]